MANGDAAAVPEMLTRRRAAAGNCAAKASTTMPPSDGPITVSRYSMPNERIVSKPAGFHPRSALHEALHRPTWKKDRAGARTCAHPPCRRVPRLDGARPRAWMMLVSRLWITAFGNAFEQHRREVTLARVGQHRK